MNNKELIWIGPMKNLRRKKAMKKVTTRFPLKKLSTTSPVVLSPRNNGTSIVTADKILSHAHLFVPFSLPVSLKTEKHTLFLLTLSLSLTLSHSLELSFILTILHPDSSFFFLSLSLSLSLIHTQAHTHTHFAIHSTLFFVISNAVLPDAVVASRFSEGLLRVLTRSRLGEDRPLRLLE
jgi:hypothetical protein